MTFEEQHPTWEWLVRTNKDLHVPSFCSDPRDVQEPANYFVCLNQHGTRVKAYGPTVEGTLEAAFKLVEGLNRSD